MNAELLPDRRAACRPLSPRSPLPGLSPRAAGIVFCAVSSLCYTAANVCMRQLKGLGVPDAQAIFARETVPTLVLGACLLAGLWRGRARWPSWRVIAEVVLVALAVQLLANLGVQWAMGVVGLAINVPVNVGTALVASAVFGAIIVGERVSPRTYAAVAVLIAALAVLGLSAARQPSNVAGSARAPLAASQPAIRGGEATDASVRASEPPTPAAASAHPTPPRLLEVIAALALTTFGGIIYATLSLTLRRHATDRAAAIAIMFLVTATGAISLGAMSLETIRWEVLAATPPTHWAWMIAAGVTNMIGFVAIATGLQLVPFVHANLFNSSQVALAAVAGVIFFLEPASATLLLGVGLTMAGIMLIGPSDAAPTPAAAAATLAEPIASLPGELEPNNPPPRAEG